MKYLFTFFLSVVIVVVAYAQPTMRHEAPEIAMKDINGGLHKLSDLKGKVVLIDFWASWCGPCRRSMPALVSLYNKYKDKGFDIYGISIDDNTNDWQNAVAADDITWIQVNEPGGGNGATARACKIDMIPASFLLDQQGKIIAVNPSDKKLAHYLKKLLR
jgi:thiol-disulfide isomerase/thioredoxin